MGLDPTALIGMGADAISGAINAHQARAAFKSRYQDTVKDMKKAGLNPALAYGQGGGNPQTNPIPELGQSYVKGVGTSAAAAQAKATADKTTAETKLLNAQTEDLIQNLRLKNRLLGKDIDFRVAQTGLAGAQTQATGAQAFKTTQEGNLAQLDFSRRSATFDSDIRAALARNAADMFAPANAAAETRGRLLENQIRELSLPELRAMASYYTGAGQYEPYANAIVRFIQGIMPRFTIQGDRTYKTNLPRSK